MAVSHRIRRALVTGTAVGVSASPSPPATVQHPGPPVITSGIEVQRHQIPLVASGGGIGVGDRVFGQFDQGVGAPGRQRLVEVGGHEPFDRRHAALCLLRPGPEP